MVQCFAKLVMLFRVADDYGKLRFTLNWLHQPLLGWKGSFIVAKASAEQAVGFDHGLQGSITEDLFFGLIAASKGFTFDFIEGEMEERAAFTVADFVRQRRRWVQGILLTICSQKIPWKYKTLLTISVAAWFLQPFLLGSMFLSL